jgi:hypothetical protein
VLIAFTATAVGFAFDAGGGTKELTSVFAALYLIGCIAAVLAVRQAGLFSAVVQPPVLLFISVPGAYFLFHGAEINGLKDILINCGYPLIERFPLMLFTSAAVLLIGLARWYVGHKSRTPVNAEARAEPRAGSLSALTAKVSSLFSPSMSEDDDADDTGRRRHAIDRASTPARKSPAKKSPAKSRRPRPAKTAARADAPRSRHARPPLTDVTELIEPVTERPRRRRPPWPEPPPEPRRRRAPAARTPGDPYERRESYERRAPRDRRSRHDAYDPFNAYDPFEAYEPAHRRRPASNGSNGSGAGNSTHHPISRVRYRGTGTTDDGRPDSPAGPRSRAWEADTWEYDI